MRHKLWIPIMLLCVTGTLSACKTQREPHNSTEETLVAIETVKESGRESTQELKESDFLSADQTEGETEKDFFALPAGIKKVQAESKKYPELEKLIIDHYEIPEEDIEETKYYYNYVDLDQDGTDEIFTVIMGPYTSGTGGDSALWVNKDGSVLQVNQAFTLVRNPIIISDKITGGAHEMIVEQSGGGVSSRYVALTFQNGKYTSVNDGKTLESLKGITGNAIIYNDIFQDIQNGTYLTLSSK